MDKKRTTPAKRPDAPGRRKTLVSVTDQFACERIIKAGRVIADITHTELTVLSIACTDHPQNPQALQYLFDISRENGAEMTVLYGDNPSRTLIQYIKGESIANLLTGMPGGSDSMLYRVWDKFSHLNCFTVSPDGEVRRAEEFIKTA